MDRKTWTLLAIMASLGTIYLVKFTDRFHRPHIQINVAIRPFAPNAGPDDLLPMVFGLDQEWRLTKITVTDPNGDAMWRMVSDKGANPAIRGFLYGEKIGGMKLFADVAPKKLAAGVPYRVEVESGGARGAVEFTPRLASSAPPPNAN